MEKGTAEKRISCSVINLIKCFFNFPTRTTNTQKMICRKLGWPSVPQYLTYFFRQLDIITISISLLKNDGLTSFLVIAFFRGSYPCGIDVRSASFGQIICIPVVCVGSIPGRHRTDLQLGEPDRRSEASGWHQDAQRLPGRQGGQDMHCQLHLGRYGRPNLPFSLFIRHKFHCE